MQSTLSQPRITRSDAAPAHPATGLGLKQRLVLVDVAALAVSWIAVLTVRTGLVGFTTTLGPYNAGWALLAVLVNLCLMSMHSLYLARVCSVRATELQGLGRSVLGTAVLLVTAEQVIGQPLPLREMAFAGLAAFAALAVGRGAYSGWLRRCRAEGRFVRDLVFVGTDADAVELAAVVREHPDLGFRVCGFVGEQRFADMIGAPHMGFVEDTIGAVRRSDATGAVLIASALDSDTLNDLVRQLLADGRHVHLSSGLRGIAQQRFRATPLAYEPLFYVEPALLTPRQIRTKRAMDIVGATLALVISAPVLAVAMLAVRLESPGPALFRQRRVGRDGTCFTFLKLRTMVDNAEALRPRMERHNQRTSGPLFKAAADPRITRVGRILRATSIDELPQLWNVLRGSMSLVGPRPALPSEVEAFDERLRTRTAVAPGLTGLWQIEARDNPAFGPYRRLDLYYVENWSPLLDVGVLLMTVSRVVSRAWRATTRHQDHPDASTEIVLD